MYFPKTSFNIPHSLFQYKVKFTISIKFYLCSLRFYSQRLSWKTFCLEKRDRPPYNQSEVISVKLKKTVLRMLDMCPDAWYIFMCSVKLTAAVLVGAILLLLRWGGSMAEGYTQYMTAMSLYEIGQALLLIGAIFSVCIEDVQTSRR